MILYTTDSLFAWNRLDDSPDLKTIRDFFEILPDGPLLEALRANRGRGRNDCPIRRLWFCVVLQRLLRHPTMRLTLEELRRNPDLRRLGEMEHADDEVNVGLKSFGDLPLRLKRNLVLRRVPRLDLDGERSAGGYRQRGRRGNDWKPRSPDGH